MQSPQFRLAAVLAAALAFATPARSAAQSDGDRTTLHPTRVTLPEGVLSILCEGESHGLPTVVLENGLDDDLTVWRTVAPEIARLTRVCSYDRLGVGSSDRLAEGDARTPFEMAHTLHALLDSVGVARPIVLVGHSIAGFALLAYGHLYPEGVAGMVFVDASHPRQAERFRAANPDRPAPDFLGAERIDRVVAGRQLGEIEGFGDLPIVVLHQAAPTDSPLRPIWLELQREHAARSTRSCLVPAPQSGHYIQRDQPNLVIEAVRWVLAAVAPSAMIEAPEWACG